MGLDSFNTDSSKSKSSSSSSNSSSSTVPPKKKKTSNNNVKPDVDLEDVDKDQWDMIITHPKDPRYEVDGIEHLGNVLVAFDTDDYPSGINHNAGLDENEFINIEENRSDYKPDTMAGENTVNIHKPEFEQVLEKTNLSFQEIDYHWADEVIYEATSSGGMFAIRVYSTICQRQKQSRATGEDSIKVNVVHNDSGQPLFTTTRTYRTRGWDERLLEKISELLEKKSEVTKCNKCGAVMVIRENQDNGNEFYGCTQYPECKNTKPVQ